MWLEIFKTGEHTSSEGVKRTYTRDDLKAIATLYNDQTDHEAPLVIGHPATDGPAHGWTKSLAVVGDSLHAFVDQVDDATRDANRRGEYKKVSLSLYGNGLLRHIGLLGAAPPAIKGLAPVKFDDGDQEVLNFGDTGTDDPPAETFREKIRTFFNGLKKRLAPDAGLDFADVEKEFGITLDTIHSQEDDMNLEELDAKWTKQFREYQESTQKIIDGQTTKIATLEKTIADGEVAHGVEIRKMQFAEGQSRFAVTVDQLIVDGKVLPAEKADLVAEFADLQEADSHITLTEGSKPLTVKFAERLAARTPQRPATRMFAIRTDAKKEEAKVPSRFDFVAPRLAADHLDLHAQAVAYAEQNKVSYEQAIEHVTAS